MAQRGDMKVDLIQRIFLDHPRNVDMRLLWQEIDSLSRTHAVKVMHLLFYENGKPTSLTLKAAGQTIGVTGERVRQIRKMSIICLRMRFKRYVVAETD